jgi:AmmeMemoRadiSam system protein A
MKDITDNINVNNKDENKKDNDIQNVSEQSPARESEEFTVSPRQKKMLLSIARSTLEHYIITGKAPVFHEKDPILEEELALFVTLRKEPGNRLRGCIGHCFPVKKLQNALPELTISSSTQDPRFPPVRENELDSIRIEISLLSPMLKVTDHNEIRIPGHGVYVRNGYKSGVFLPQVADETGWDRETFMACLCQEKAGLHPASWKLPETEKFVFTVVKFEEGESESQ